jgi:hypothetical protein
MLSVDSDNMVLTLKMAQGEIIYTPRINDKGQVTWTCSGGDGFKPKQLPASCRGGGGE